LIAELKKQSDKPFEWLINTHHHADHTSGNIAFKGLAKNMPRILIRSSIKKRYGW